MGKHRRNWSDMSKFHVAYVAGQPRHETMSPKQARQKTILKLSKRPKTAKATVSNKPSNGKRNIPGDVSNVSPSYKLRYISGPIIFFRGGAGRPR